MRKFVINGFSGCLFAALVLVGIVMLALMFLRGGVWLGEIALPFFQWLARITFCVVVVILLPMAAFHRTQRAAASGLIQASSLFGITLWVWGLLLTYDLWGGAAVLLGVCLLGIGGRADGDGGDSDSEDVADFRAAHFAGGAGVRHQAAR